VLPSTSIPAVAPMPVALWAPTSAPPPLPSVRPLACTGGDTRLDQTAGFDDDARSGAHDSRDHHGDAHHCTPVHVRDHLVNGALLASDALTQRDAARSTVPALAGAPYSWPMSAERDELRDLIEELPDAQVAAVLADVRRHLTPTSVGQWPPAWVGAIVAGRTDVGRNHNDLLADGFGRG
jgi:hypothetical protein